MSTSKPPITRQNLDAGTKFLTSLADWQDSTPKGRYSAANTSCVLSANQVTLDGLLTWLATRIAPGTTAFHEAVGRYGDYVVSSIAEACACKFKGVEPNPNGRCRDWDFEIGCEQVDIKVTSLESGKLDIPDVNLIQKLIGNTRDQSRQTGQSKAYIILERPKGASPLRAKANLQAVVNGVIELIIAWRSLPRHELPGGAFCVLVRVDLAGNVLPPIL